MKQFILIFFFLFFSSINAITKKNALIFGISGQDGTYLTELLLEKGYTVHGVVHKTMVPPHLTENKQYQYNFFLHSNDLSNIDELIELIEKIEPDEIYNLAAQSQVKASFDCPVHTAKVNALGTLNILEAIKKNKRSHKIKFYQASSSEMFGKTQEALQNENTPFQPCSPYAVSKMFAYWITKNYRQTYQIFACNGILFNHESPMRGENFVTRKISQFVARIYKGDNTILYLGNLDVQRDWGYAKDYVKAMWLILQQDNPDDYVIATGIKHTVRDFVELAFKEIGITIAWKGKGLDEIGYNKETDKILVRIDPQYFRPNEIQITLGDPSKAKRILQWEPTTSFSELVKIMVQEDIRRIK